MFRNFRHQMYAVGPVSLMEIGYAIAAALLALRALNFDPAFAPLLVKFLLIATTIGAIICAVYLYTRQPAEFPARADVLPAAPANWGEVVGGVRYNLLQAVRYTAFAAVGSFAAFLVYIQPTSPRYWWTVFFVMEAALFMAWQLARRANAHLMLIPEE